MNLLKEFERAIVGFLVEFWLPIVVAIIIILCLFAALAEQQQWQNFALANHCKIVSKEQDQIISTTTYDSKGNAFYGTTVVYGKTGWKCDDGKTYYR